MKRWLKSDAALLLWRMALVYLALALCRAAFALYNMSDIGFEGGITHTLRLLRGAAVFDTASVIYANALFILMSLLPFRLRGNKGYRGIMFWQYIVINSAVIAVSLADAVYYRYTHKRFTSEEIFFADNDNSLLLVLKFAAENWYLLLYGALLIAMLVSLYGRKTVPNTPIKNGMGYYAFSTVILAAAVGLCIGGVRGGFSRMTRPITLSNATQWAATPAEANLILSNPFCIIRTISRDGNAGCKTYFDSQTLDSIFTPEHRPANVGGSQKGKNVVIFIMESFSAEHSAFLNPDLYPDGRGYTPFLDSLMRQGYAFTRAYANGHKSIEALPSVLGSIPSFKTPFVLLPQSIGRSHQLPAILSDAGYNTLFFCGSARGSMGFEAYMRAAGVKQFFGKEDYEKERGGKDFDGYWGIWDQKFLDYMGEKLSSTPQPFLSTVFTISSHHPFIVPEKYKDSLPKGTTKIHRPVAYTDMAVRDFFARWGHEPWFENSVFVFVADHVSSEKWAPKTKTEIGRNHIIEFLYTPDGSLRGTDPSTVQQTDIMPTLLGLLGNTEPYFAFGRDIFSEPERTPFAMKYANGYYYAITDSLTVAFDESDITAAYSVSDTLLSRNILSDIPQNAICPLKRRIQATVQRYYESIKKQDYTVHNSN